jgi:sarcosine oxidase subunit beta
MNSAKKHYSGWSLLREGIGAQTGWSKAWQDRDPASRYDVVIIGGGNTGRNTTIVRSNYLWDESAALYEKSLQLFEGLSQELNYNIMFSQRGVLNLAHNLGDVREGTRRINALRLNGIDSEWMTP